MFVLHMKLVGACIEKFQEKDLETIGELEQCLATGVKENGATVNSSKVLSKIINEIASEKLKEEDKLRIVMLVIICQSLREKERNALLGTLENEKDHNAIYNLA